MDPKRSCDNVARLETTCVVKFDASVFGKCAHTRHYQDHHITRAMHYGNDGHHSTEIGAQPMGQ